jgi:hypothetical protein
MSLKAEETKTNKNNALLPVKIKFKQTTNNAGKNIQETIDLK